jgi:hypothetical protein
MRFMPSSLLLSVVLIKYDFLVLATFLYLEK